LDKVITTIETAAGIDISAVYLVSKRSNLMPQVVTKSGRNNPETTSNFSTKADPKGGPEGTARPII
jgi:hypothetical protein